MERLRRQATFLSRATGFWLKGVPNQEIMVIGDSNLTTIERAGGRALYFHCETVSIPTKSPRNWRICVCERANKGCRSEHKTRGL